ncbi:MAG: peptide ABC transporter substrate-binding protein [Candidatus Limnocylindrales bacterium]
MSGERDSQAPGPDTVAEASSAPPGQPARSPVPSSWLPPDLPPARPASRRRRVVAAAIIVLLAAALVLPLQVLELGPGPTPSSGTAPALQHGTGSVRIAGSTPATWDPSQQGDSGTAAVLAQLFEGLTSVGASLRVEPALAQSWTVDPGGLRVSFQLRPGLVFSDGSPLTAGDVVASWLRILDPAHPGPLASLLDDVAGAVAYRQGHGPESAVGIRAVGDTVVISLLKPAAYFPAIAANPALAVAPGSEAGELAGIRPPSPFVGSGAYTVVGDGASGITLQANPRYWAGPPAIGSVTVVTDFNDQGPVAAFTAGTVDYTPVDQADANWIRYDPQLGPQLREEPSLSVTYYGFNTRRAPFDDVRVRRAFAWAVDWRRIALLADGPGSVATSMVPPGIPGRPTGDYLPMFDPAAARAELAAAGYPGGRDLPPITMVTSGTTYDAAVIEQIAQHLGITVSLETMAPDAYMARLADDAPAIWSMSWIADYAAPGDFLGILLQSDATSNYGGWANAGFDAALDAAGRTGDPAAQARAYGAAEAIVRDQVPVVPLSYAAPGAQGDVSWALSRTGLLGATTGALGIPRFAGLAWSR